jgi:hypothetical protein
VAAEALLMDEPVVTCPYCKWDRCTAHFEYMDFGYQQQVGPYGCDTCHAVEIGPHDGERELHELEQFTGWYLPDPQCIPPHFLEKLDVSRDYAIRKCQIERRAAQEKVAREQQELAMRGYGQW